MKSALGTRYRSKTKQHHLNPAALVTNEPDFEDRPLEGIRLDILFKRMEELKPGFRQNHTRTKKIGNFDGRGEKDVTKESMVIRGNRGEGVHVGIKKDQGENIIQKEVTEVIQGESHQQSSQGQRDTRERKPRPGQGSDRDGTRTSGRRSGFSDFLEIKNMLSAQNEVNSQHFKVLQEGQRFNKIEVQGIKSDVNNLNDRVKNLEYNVKNLEKRDKDRDRYKVYRYSRDSRDSRPRKDPSGHRIYTNRISYHDHREKNGHIKRPQQNSRDNRHTYSERAIRDEYNSLQTQSNSNRQDPFSFGNKNRKKWASTNLRSSERIQKISKSRSPKTSRDPNLKNSKMEVVSEVSEPKSDQATSSKKNSQSRVQDGRVSSKKHSSGGQLDKSSEIIFFGNNTANFIYSTEQSQISIIPTFFLKFKAFIRENS